MRRRRITRRYKLVVVGEVEILVPISDDSIGEHAGTRSTGACEPSIERLDFGRRRREPGKPTRK